LFETAHAAAASDGAQQSKIRSQLEAFDREIHSQQAPRFTDIPPDADEIAAKAKQVQV
jgi:hypothetical protein